jgi:hypothetical protein
MSDCPHEFWEREASVGGDGYCPLCMAAEIERLRQGNKAVDAQEMSDIAAEMRKAAELRGDTYSSMEIWGLLGRGADEIERLRALVKDLADDLEAELRGHYGPVLDYPSERRRFERDMDNVYKARRALEGK